MKGMTPEEGYTVRINHMHKDDLCTVIDVNFMVKEIRIQNYTDNLLWRAFGKEDNPNWKDFNLYLESRCFPRTRGNIKSILKELNLMDYDPLQIVEKTGGRKAEDHLWLSFEYFPIRE